jgi:hypothetical protein
MLARLAREVDPTKIPHPRQDGLLCRVDAVQPLEVERMAALHRNLTNCSCFIYRPWDWSLARGRRLTDDENALEVLALGKGFLVRSG